MSFQYPYDDDTYDVEPQKFAEHFIDGGTVTIGTGKVEWITSDTIMEVRR